MTRFASMISKMILFIHAAVGKALFPEFPLQLRCLVSHSAVSPLSRPHVSTGGQSPSLCIQIPNPHNSPNTMKVRETFFFSPTAARFAVCATACEDPFTKLSHSSKRKEISTTNVELLLWERSCVVTRVARGQ